MSENVDTKKDSMNLTDVFNYIIVSEHELSKLDFNPSDDEDENVNEMKTAVRMFLTSLGMVLHSCTILDKFDIAKYNFDYMKQINDLPKMIQIRKEQRS